MLTILQKSHKLLSDYGQKITIFKCYGHDHVLSELQGYLKEEIFKIEVKIIVNILMSSFNTK